MLKSFDVNSADCFRLKILPRFLLILPISMDWEKVRVFSPCSFLLRVEIPLI